MGKIIIGIGGQKRAGKNLVAETMSLQAQYNGLSTTISSFAYPIKDMLQYLFRNEVPEGTFTSDDHKQDLVNITPDSALSVRTLLQKVGTECFRDIIHPDIWVYRALYALPRFKENIIFFPDVRFENELKAIKKAGGHTIYVTRLDYEMEEDLHPSETELLRIQHMFDYQIKAKTQDVVTITNMSKFILTEIVESSK